MKPETYFFSSTLTKTWAIWIQEGSCCAPLVYLKKPKWIDAKQWEDIVKSIRLDLPKGFVVGESK